MKMSSVITIVLTCLVLQSANATYITVADSVAEFSGTQGSDNWYYGYRTNTDGTLGGTFGPFTQMTDFYSSQWRRDVSGSIDPSYLLLGQQNSHPDNDASSESGTFEFSARRWVSEVSGEITITGTVRKIYIGDGSLGDSGDGFVLAIFKNGSLYARVAGLLPLGTLDAGPNIVTGGSALAGWSYMTNMTVAVGDNIEFLHGSFTDITSDGAIFTAYILQNVVPEPSTVLLLSVGGIILWRHRKRLSQ